MWRLIVIALLLGAASVDAAAPAADVEPLIKQGNTYFFKKKFKEALSVYKQAYDASRNVSLLYGMAQCHKRLGDYEQSLALLEKYQKLLPRGKTRAVVDEQIKDLKLALEMKAEKPSEPVQVALVDAADAAPSTPAVPPAAPSERAPTAVAELEAASLPVMAELEPLVAPPSKPETVARAKPKPRPKSRELVVQPGEAPVLTIAPPVEGQQAATRTAGPSRASLAAKLGAFVPFGGLRVNYELGANLAISIVPWLRGHLELGFVLVRGSHQQTSNGVGRVSVVQNSLVVPLTLGASFHLAQFLSRDWPVRPYAGVQAGAAVLSHSMQAFGREESRVLLRPLLAFFAGGEVPILPTVAALVELRALALRAQELAVVRGVPAGQASLTGLSVRVGASLTF